MVVSWIRVRRRGVLESLQRGGNTVLGTLRREVMTGGILGGGVGVVFSGCHAGGGSSFETCVESECLPLVAAQKCR